tara:strand:+ start:92 stop:727 length:636 start_codon:yes stop_codon:yes gene_type:complete
MDNLTVLIEDVEKPHNLSAIMRTCDAVGVLEISCISQTNKPKTFNKTAQGSQKWININQYNNAESAIKKLKTEGFKIYGTVVDVETKDYRDLNYVGPTAFVLGAEKWGLSSRTSDLIDEALHIPMRGMVQSLNVSVAAATLLYEAIRQRDIAGLLPNSGEGIKANLYQKYIFEWSYPEIAKWYQSKGRKYPKLNEDGEIIDDIPRTIKFRC